MAKKENIDYRFNELVDIVKKLRGPDGCLWDRKQTLETLKPYLVEEMYEVIEAIDKADYDKLKEELGDLLFQVLFLTQVNSEKKRFDMTHVLEGSIKKMISRHPHVFGDEKAKDIEQALKIWNDAKKKEKKHKSSDIDYYKALPGLVRAWQIQRKTLPSRLDKKEKNQLISKIQEELESLRENKTSKRKANESIGSIIFKIVALSRSSQIHPEEALMKALDDFIKKMQRTG